MFAIFRHVHTQNRISSSILRLLDPVKYTIMEYLVRTYLKMCERIYFTGCGNSSTENSNRDEIRSLNDTRVT